MNVHNNRSWSNASSYQTTCVFNPLLIIFSSSRVLMSFTFSEVVIVPLLLPHPFIESNIFWILSLLISYLPKFLVFAPFYNFANIFHVPFIPSILKILLSLFTILMVVLSLNSRVLFFKKFITYILKYKCIF